MFVKNIRKVLNNWSNKISGHCKTTLFHLTKVKEDLKKKKVIIEKPINLHHLLAKAVL